MNHVVPNIKESFIQSKKGESALCGDEIAISEHYVAVIDGATPKGVRTWEGMPGDVYVAKLLKNAVLHLPATLTATEAINLINDAVKEAYNKAGVSFESLSPEEHLQASIVIYSAPRKEVWLFGDCQFRVNGENFTATRRGDLLLAELRAFHREIARLEALDDERDHGREAILPLLKKYVLFANADSEFGYDAITGGPLHVEHVMVHPVNTGDLIVLSSDGYPHLWDTLAETEADLFTALAADPDCIGMLRSTKGLQKGYKSFDDRSFVSFTV